MKNLWNKFKATKGYRIVKILMDSASFALFLSVAFFAYEMSEGKRETEEVVDNLREIQNSLSTRYLGLFPEYISSINKIHPNTMIPSLSSRMSYMTELEAMLKGLEE